MIKFYKKPESVVTIKMQGRNITSSDNVVTSRSCQVICEGTLKNLASQVFSYANEVLAKNPSDNNKLRTFGMLISDDKDTEQIKIRSHIPFSDFWELFIDAK